MKTTNRTPLLAMIALGAAFAAPAFAQQMQQPPTSDAATPAAAAPTGQTSSSAASSSQGQQGWNDLDTDKDGAISKAESSANPGLSQIFSQADGDADGKLTQDEYKAFVVKNYGGGAGQPAGQ